MKIPEGMKVKNSSSKTIFICSFKNEEFAAKVFINELIQTLNQFRISFKLVLIDDGSDDNTAEVLEKFASNKVKIEILPSNVGKIAAQAIGMKKYHEIGSGTLFFDGDGQHSASEIASIATKGVELKTVIVGMRTSQYKRKISARIGTSILRKIFLILGIQLDLEKSELIYLPPNISKQLTNNQNLGFVPVNSILNESSIPQEIFPINIRKRFSNNSTSNFTRHSTKDLFRKAILQLFYNPWQIITRIFLLGIIPLVAMLAYGVFIGIVSITQHNKNGIASVIILISFSTLIIIMLQLINIALTTVVHEKIVLAQSLKVESHDAK